MTFCLGFGAGAYLPVLSPKLLSSELSVPLQHLVQCHRVQVNIPGWAPLLSVAMEVICTSESFAISPWWLLTA